MEILLVDDHGLVRAGARAVLEAKIAGARVREADSLASALRADEEPDVVVLDVQLQGVSGLEGLAMLARKWPDVPVVMLSSNPDEATVREARARGAAAFVAKADPVERLIEAVERAVNAPGISAAAAPPLLTPRQLEVLDLLAQGLSNKAAAKRLHLSEFTVRGHVQAILGILGVSSRSEGVFVARARGLLR